MLQQTKLRGSATGRFATLDVPVVRLLPASSWRCHLRASCSDRPRPRRTRSDAGRQLVVDTQYDQQTADPARDASISGRYILGSVYDTLTSFKAKQVNGKLSVSLSKPVPWLATSWKSNPAGTVWTFNLRQGVKFSNGDPLTAADVVFSLLRVKNVNAAPAFITASFKSVKAVGDDTVVITTKQPNPAVPYLVAYKSTGVVDSKVAKAERRHGRGRTRRRPTRREKWFNTNSIGSGPYTFQSLQHDRPDRARGEPELLGQEARVRPDRVPEREARRSRVLDVKSGQAQMALGLTPEPGRLDRRQREGVQGAEHDGLLPPGERQPERVRARRQPAPLAGDPLRPQLLEPRPPRRRRCGPGVRCRSAPVPGRAARRARA